jgi:AraC-like DNA-binding protein
VDVTIYTRYSKQNDRPSARKTLSPASSVNSILPDLRLRGAHYCRAEVSQPWGLTLPYQEGVRFHFVVEGNGWLIIDDRAPILMQMGDIVLLPRGSAHVIADQPDRQPAAVEEFSPQSIGDKVYRLQAGGTGEKALIICSTLSFEHPSVHPLIAMMPETLHVRPGDFADPALPVLIDLMTIEAQHEMIGWATVMTRIADVILTRIIRGWVIRQAPGTTGWLAAIGDPHIGRALAVIHAHPETARSVKSLATTAGLSRSVFNQRFVKMLGVSPAKYLVSWRMRLADGWLSDGSLSVAKIADKLGYGSEAAFSRAFKRLVGKAPGALRKSKTRGDGS